MCKSKEADKSGQKKADAACDGGVSPCKDEVVYRLVSITVISNATQTNVTGAKNWATIKKSTDEVIVQAKTSPDDATGWSKINWSGDFGLSVDGHPNQRKLSRDQSKKLHVQAELGGVTDSLDVWVIWATVTIQISGTTPANAVQFNGIEDGTEKLGAVVYNSGKAAAGKVAPTAQLSPAGLNSVVKRGWSFKRERISHDWADGVKVRPGSGTSDYWNTGWVDDTSLARWTNLIPTNDATTGSVDQIFDLDGPNVLKAGSARKSYETYNNFRQWIEWNNEKCSDFASWYWKGVWNSSATPNITLKDVGTGNVTLPGNPSIP